MRISDLFLAFPGLVFALAVAGVLGGGIQNAIIALAVISWPKFARLARGLTLTQKDSAYLMAAKLSGSSTGKLLLKHILPNIAGPILVTYRNHDDGAGRTFLSRTWCKASNGRMGKYDQRWKKYAADFTVDGTCAGNGDFYYGNDL